MWWPDHLLIALSIINQLFFNTAKCLVLSTLLLLLYTCIFYFHLKSPPVIDPPASLFIVQLTEITLSWLAKSTAVQLEHQRKLQLIKISKISIKALEDYHWWLSSPKTSKDHLHIFKNHLSGSHPDFFSDFLRVLKNVYKYL